MFFKLLFMCLPMMWVGSMVGSMLSLALPTARRRTA